MRDDKWIETVAMIKSKFTVLEEGRQEIEDIPKAFCEFIEFEGPEGRMRLERTTQPAVTGKKTIYSKLGGRASKVEYEYSPDEVVHKFRAYRWSYGREDWEEVKAPQG